MKLRMRLIAMSAIIMGLAGIAPAFAADASASAAVKDSTQTVDAKAADRSLKGDEACTRCHDESENKPILSYYQTRHGVKGDPRTPGCQSCHGPSESHLKGDKTGKGRPAPDVVFNKGVYQKSDAKERAGVCLTCHTGTNRTHWEGSQHQANQMACNDCHTNHAAADKVLSKKTQPQVCFACHKEQRADTHKISTHPIDAGKIACSDCHNPHGSPGPKLLKKSTVTETCFTCHAEKRGPFLWEHQPVTEDCTNCHTPHGSNISPLLKSRPPFLCQECHNGPHNSKSPAGPNAAGIQGGFTGANPSTQAVARGCMNCHVMVHGSNSPAGAYLHR